MQHILQKYTLHTCRESGQSDPPPHNVLSAYFAFVSKSSNVGCNCFMKEYLRIIKPFTFVGIMCIVASFVPKTLESIP